MILLCGIPTEAPLAMVASELAQQGRPFLFLNQRRFQAFGGNMEIRDGACSGWFEYEGRSYSLADFRGIYARLMDDSRLAEYDASPPNSAPRAVAAARQDWLVRWLNLAPALVVNRPASMASNGSKPWQAQIIRRHGFSIPATLITTDPTEVGAFRRRFGRIIYKSISSVRSIVQELRSEDDARLEQIRWCPTQFQEWVPGNDIRVHVVGRRCFATEILSDATDYRYAAAQTGSAAELRPMNLNGKLADRCVSLAAALGLEFAGIDLRISPTGRVVCFEVNPSPAYSFYENQTGQPIAAAVASHLAGDADA